ncbi:MAG TPA: hypothetical protein VK652_13590 [Steroidobacteraceae bacterium]|nr:hypothetical protein [Steroidobacteraceae bacterium]
MADNPFAQFAPSSGAGTNPFAQFAPLAQPATFQEPEDEKLYRQELAKTQANFNEARVPTPEGIGTPATPEAAAIEGVQRQRGMEGEQKAYEATRTGGKIITDAASFLASMPVRMATRGEYGAGDVVGAVAPKTGESISESERDFARANEGKSAIETHDWRDIPTLATMQHVGEIAPAIPMLNTMGAAPRGIAAVGARIANKPVPESTVARAAVRNERLADIDAFKAAGVEPFGPALTEAGTAGTVKQLSEAPFFIGAPIRNRLERAIGETRDAGERVASEYGDARTYRDVGNVAEQGINRFKDARSADTIENSAAKLSNERLSEIVSEPARETSIKTKQDALYERAWRGIPEEMQKGKSKKDTTRFLGNMTNTKAVLDDLTARNQRMMNETRGGEPVDPRLAFPIRGGVAGQIAEDIMGGKWRGTLQTMRDVRSNFRRLASGMADTEKNTLNLSDMRRIQSAMTEDMIELLDRNVEHYTKAGKPETATAVKRAIHDFRRADQFTKASVGRLDTLEKLYGAQSAEQLALGITKDAMGGRKGGNFARLTALRRSLKDDEWGDISSGIIREMGRPVGSARGLTEDAGFSVNSAITNWKNMSEEGKNVLFNQTRDGRSLRVALDRFTRVADRMANFEAMANTSRSTTNALGLTALFSLFNAVGQAAVGNVGPAAALATPAAGAYAFGKFMSSPAYVRWLTRAAELSGNPGKLRALRVHARDLARLAEREPDPQVQNLMHVLTMKLVDTTAANRQ